MGPEETVEFSDKNADIPAQRHTRKTVKALFVFSLFLCLFFFFSIIALNRPADVDEGFFLIFGKSLFLYRRKMYIDFLSAQMLLPYVYGFVMRVFGFKWGVARVLTSLFAASTGMILCAYALRKTGSKLFAAAIAIIYGFTPFIFIWFTCARTFALATLFLLGSVVLLPPINKRRLAFLYAASGILLGLSINARLYIFAVVPFLAFHVGYIEKEEKRAVVYFLAGLVGALLLNLPFFAASPKTFTWGLIGFTAARTSQGLIGALDQKLDLLLQLLFNYPSLRPTLYLGYMLIFAAYLVHKIVGRIPLSRWNPAFYAAGSVFFVSLLPTPTYGRYFCIPIPFFMLLAIDLVQSSLKWIDAGSARKAITGGIALGSLLFAVLAIGKLDYYIFKGNSLEGSMPTEGGKEDWFLNNVKSVSQAIDKHVAPDARVLSFWPGYLLEAKVFIMPHTENLTMLELEDKLPDSKVAISQTISDAEIRNGISNKHFDLLVYGNSIAPHVSEYKALLIANEYTVAERVGGISLYLSPEYERQASTGP